MKKSIKFATLAIISTFLLAACNSEGGGGRSDRVKVIKYLVSVDSTAYTEILNDLIDEFNEEIKDEGYKIETQVPGGNYYESLGTMIAANRTPDIFMMEYGYFNAYKHSMLDLSQFLDVSTNLSHSDLWNLNDYYKDGGKVKALIKDFSPDFMLIYNKTMLDSYNAAHPDKQYHLSRTEPVTWEYFFEMTSAIQSSGMAQYGTSLGFEGVKHLHDMVQQTGSSMYINDDKEVNITDKNVREAFACFLSLQKDNVTQGGKDTAPEIQKYGAIQALNNGKSPASYTSGSSTSEQQLFMTSRCFSIFNGLYSFPSYDFYSLSKESGTFDYDVAPHPVQSEGDDPFGTTSAMVSHAISSKTKYKDICWRFLEFYQTEGLSRISKIAYNIPGNKTIASSDSFLKNDNPKVEDMVNYFYDFVNSGYCVPTTYNSRVDYATLSTCYSTAWNEYYNVNNPLTFDGLMNKINTLIKNQTW